MITASKATLAPKPDSVPKTKYYSNREAHRPPRKKACSHRDPDQSEKRTTPASGETGTEVSKADTNTNTDNKKKIGDSNDPAIPFLGLGAGHPVYKLSRHFYILVYGSTIHNIQVTEPT